MKLKKQYAGSYKIIGHNRDIQSTLTAQILIQRFGVAMDVGSLV